MTRRPCSPARRPPGRAGARARARSPSAAKEIIVVRQARALLIRLVVVVSLDIVHTHQVLLPGGVGGHHRGRQRQGRRVPLSKMPLVNLRAAHIRFVGISLGEAVDRYAAGLNRQHFLAMHTGGTCYAQNKRGLFTASTERPHYTAVSQYGCVTVRPYCTPGPQLYTFRTKPN